MLFMVMFTCMCRAVGKDLSLHLAVENIQVLLSITPVLLVFEDLLHSLERRLFNWGCFTELNIK